jgi:hypothetical protein
MLQEESKRSCGRGREGDREQNVALARFLEETFQLQRYMVATGQKLLEMQSRIATTLARAAVAGGGISDGNGHTHHNLPMLLAGGGSGSIKGGRHLKFSDAPMANLLVTMMDKAGVPVEQFGDSTGKIAELGL